MGSDGVTTKGLTFDQLALANANRNRAAFGVCDDWTPSDWACALAGEAGEFCNLVKKLRRGDPVDAADLGRELADVVIYAELNAHRHGIDLGL